ncbi:GATA transcription factor 21 [Rhodamnia argentea]|uniref:GATA transcription factor 21 n=1 Tax=Rhodamnia argentea TaxID=178133 RepID=A0A8B8Q5J7_9MYRT|nr:GATA transcription factor 21 [Rhodamnia argentea]
MDSANYGIILPSRLVLDLNEDHQSHELFLMSPPKSEVSSSSSVPLSSPSPIFYNLLGQDLQGGSCKCEDHRQHEKLQHPQEVDHEPVSRGESYGGHGLNITLWKNGGGGGGGGGVRDESDQADKYYSVKWMSSKMRIMKKMMSSDHHEQSRDNAPMMTSGSISAGGDHKLFVEDHKRLPSSSSLETDSSSNSSSYNANPIRVCSDCNTTKTPLWRSGPRGPKSLCNACGIRQRKARRAMAAAAVAATDSGALPPATTLSPKSKLKQHNNQRSSRAAGCGQEPIKKKRKAKPHNNHASTGGRKLCLEEFAIRLSKHLAFQRVFPQEEKEAAILLMALSYGLVHG